MKNLSIVFNVVLLVLVCILFAMYFSLKKTISGGDASTSHADTTANITTHKGSEKAIRIAFVNADSINSEYQLMTDFKKEITARQMALQSEYESKAKVLQDEYVAYQQKVQANNISQLDAEKAQKDMEAKKAVIDELQHRQDDMVKEVQDKNLKLQAKIQNYIVDVNKKLNFDYVLAYAGMGSSVLYANNYYNITSQVISGLNAQYKDSLQKAGKH
ncbi:MAG TPA: OmpH family outer membrane protein [Bacteroidia bacterium]|jgi:outer membrane protein|nr:OmpH family outer membrane protein [Bacteroidia bacterium]